MPRQAKPFLVTYRLADEHGNLDDHQATTTVHATSAREARSIVQRKSDYRAVITNIRKGGV